jgi:hypothetical protein
VHFLRDVGRVFDELPLLPPELDIGVAYFGSSWRNCRLLTLVAAGEIVDERKLIRTRKKREREREREREGEKTNTTRFAPQMLSGGPRPPRSLVV